MRIILVVLFVLISIVALYEYNQNVSRELRIATLLDSIQTAISAADPSENAYYETSYRTEESAYWSKIPRWIVEDAELRQLIAPNELVKILDVGCGYGTLLAFASAEYQGSGVCLDIIPYLQPEIQQRYAITYVKTDVEKDAFPADLMVDVVLMTEVIEHLNFHPRFTLEKIYAALKPGGSFFLSTPDAEHGWGRMLDYYRSLDEMPPPDADKPWIDGHIWQYTEREIREVLENAGFTIERLTRSSGIVGKHFNIWVRKPIW